jgi:uncharacterized protein
MTRRPIYVLSMVLVILGALNWLLVALARLDLIALVAGLEFGEVGGFNGAVYAIVGLAGLYLAIASWVSPKVSSHTGDTRPLPR